MRSLKRVAERRPTVVPSPPGRLVRPVDRLLRFGQSVGARGLIRGEVGDKRSEGAPDLNRQAVRAAEGGGQLASGCPR